MKIPKHYRLIAEHPTHFEIHDTRDGRSFPIAKSGLEPAMQKKLAGIQKFDDGGEVKDDTPGDAEVADEKADRDLAWETTPAAAPETTPAAAPAADAAQAQPAEPQPSLGYRIGQGIRNFAGENPFSSERAIEKTPLPPGVTPPIADFVQGLSGAPMPQAIPPAAPNPMLASTPEVGAPAATPAAPASPTAMPDSKILGDLNGGLGAERNAILAGVKAEGAAGNTIAKAYDDALAQMPKETPQSIYDRHAKADQQFQELLANQKLDPNRYWHNKSTGSKIAAGISLILGGMASGTLGYNPAMQNINKAIENDIEAQKNDQSRTMNLWKMNREASNSEMEANEKTRNQLFSVVKAKAEQAAAKAQGPIARMNAAKMMMEIDQAMAQNRQRLALMQASTATPGQPIYSRIQRMRAIDPAQAKELEGRYVPLPGGAEAMAYTPDDAKAVKEQVATVAPITSQLDRLDALGPSALVPGTKAHAEAEAIRAQLIPAINENAGLKRLSEYDIAIIRQMMNDPTKFSNLVGGKARSNTLRRFLMDKLVASAGARLEGGYPENATQSFAAPEVRTMNGVAYRKVKGGWQRVK